MSDTVALLNAQDTDSIEEEKTGELYSQPASYRFILAVYTHDICRDPW